VFFLKMRKLTKLLYDGNGKGKKVIVKERFYGVDYVMVVYCFESE